MCHISALTRSVGSWSYVPYLGANPFGRELGFAPLSAVEQAAGLLPGVSLPNPGLSVRRKPRGHWVEVSPGVVKLRSEAVDGWEAREPSFGSGGGRGEVSGWTARSRARMTMSLARLDWAPVLTVPGTKPAMVTLTYPGDWRTVCPDGRTAKDHLDRFRRQWQRDFVEAPGRPDAPQTARVVPLAGVWKLEHQRRGAPHFHLYAPCPLGRVAVRRGKGRAARWVEMDFMSWVSTTWADIVGAEGEERRRHRLAGTGVDFAEGVRSSDPKRLAVYFTRHTAKGSKNKAYQHELPEDWPHHGRWWGVWGLRPSAVEVAVDEADFVEVRRLLRKWVRSQGRVTPRQVQRVNQVTGEVRRRKVTRRYSVRALGFDKTRGAFVLVNDAPALAAAIGTWLTIQHAAELAAGSSLTPGTSPER